MRGLLRKFISIVIVSGLLASCAPAGQINNSDQAQGKATVTSSTPLPIEQTAVHTLEPTTTETLKPAPSSTPTATATITPTPTPTVEATTAAEIEAMRNVVGDKPEDWFILHKNVVLPHAYGARADLVEFKMVYLGLDARATNQTMMNGNGEIIAVSKIGFKGMYLIGNEKREASFAWYIENKTDGKCWMMSSAYFDCASLTPANWTPLSPEKTAERKEPNELGALPGMVISIFLLPPGQGDDKYAAFNNLLWNGRENQYADLIAGKPFEGPLFPVERKIVCDANNLANKDIIYMCQSKAEPNIFADD